MAPGVSGGLVLAAGAGTRFGAGGPKLLAELAGRPLLQHVVDAICEVSELERIVVVLGSGAEPIRAAIDFGRAEPVLCREWADGISASLRTGAATLAGAERVLVTLGDTPDISPALIRRLLDAPDGARATYGGRPGHPVILGPAELAAVHELTGDEGARRLLSGAAGIECGDLAAGRDIDTAEDLEAARRA